MKEVKIGETINLDGVTYGCCENYFGGCRDCDLQDKDYCCYKVICSGLEREDNTSVFFEKVGTDPKEEKIKLLTNALTALIELKDLKNKYGKTKDYLKQQPKAWELARLTLKKVNKEE